VLLCYLSEVAFNTSGYTQVFSRMSFIVHCPRRPDAIPVLREHCTASVNLYFPFMCPVTNYE